MAKFPSESRRSGRLARMVVFAAAAAVSMAAVSQARADVTDQLLDQLRAKGVLTHGEYSKLKSRHAAEKAEMGRPYSRHYSKDGVVVVPDDRYLTRLDKGIGFHIPGLITKEGEVGAIDVKISGDLIFGGVEDFQQKTNGSAIGHAIVGGTTASSSVNAENNITVGLLPSAIVLSIATNQMGYDLGFTIGAYTGGDNVTGVGGANSAGNAQALGSPGIDLRQVFGTVGTPTFGSVKIGRDLGLFGSDAILNDATLLGFGTTPTISQNSNTTLGRIGVGYVYADWIPQVTYTTPDFNGFTASLGAFAPYNATNSLDNPILFVGGPADTLTIHESEAPQVQAQIKWKGVIAPGANLTVSGDALWQEHKADIGDTAFLAPGAAIESWGVDGFAKLDIDGFSFVAYGYYGKGLGTTGLFLNGFDFAGDPRTSFGGYGQASYTWDKFTFGASFGVSALNLTGAEDTGAYYTTVSQYLVKDNESIIGFARYQLTPWMALQAEYGHSWSINQSGGKISVDDIAFGTAWFF